MSPKRHITGFWLVFYREWIWLFRRPFLFAMSTVLPLCAFVVLATVYLYAIPTGLAVAVLDKDGSTISRATVQSLGASERIRITGKLTNLSEGRHGIISGRYFGVLLIPDRFQKDLLAGRQPELTFFYNDQIMSPGKQVAAGAGAALPAVSDEVRIRLNMALGMSSVQAVAAVNPIPLQVHGLFNPRLDYTYFLLPALAAVVLQLTVALAGAYSFGIDMETAHRGRILRRLGGGFLPAFLGKFLPITILFCAIHAIFDIILYGYFGLPLAGNGWVLTGSAIIFIVTCQLIGVMFAGLAQKAPLALSTTAAILSPSFGYLGITFPRSGMSDFAYDWGNFFPAMWYMKVRVDQTVRGADIIYSAKSIAMQLVLMLIIAAIVYILMLLARRDFDRRKMQRLA